MRGDGARIQMMQDQERSYTLIATPVSATKYEWRLGTIGSGAALGTQTNVRIYAIEIHVTWVTTQPNPLEVYLTIDGLTKVFSFTNPVSTTNYFGIRKGDALELILSVTDPALNRAFLTEGRSVKIEASITWATTQPTNLSMTVAWAKIP